MYRFYLIAIDIIPAVVILIPVYWLMDKLYFHNLKRSFLYFVLSCYLSAVYVVVGMPNVTYIDVELNLNLLPFLGLIDDWKNSILNVLLFIPLGLILPVLLSKFRSSKNTTLFGFGMSITIEILQIFTFRATDVNDLITNTLGTFLGFHCANILLNKFPESGRWGDEGKSSELVTVLTIAILIMFFVHPFISSALWDLVL